MSYFARTDDIFTDPFEKGAGEWALFRAVSDKHLDIFPSVGVRDERAEAPHEPLDIIDVLNLRFH